VVLKEARISSHPFKADPDYFNLIDIIAKTYGKLPSEVIKLSWTELMICLRCVISRGERARQAMRNRKKDDIIVPTISITDLIDII
jgi:hypothetical protein